MQIIIQFVLTITLFTYYRILILQVCTLHSHKHWSATIKDPLIVCTYLLFPEITLLFNVAECCRKVEECKHRQVIFIQRQKYGTNIVVFYLHFLDKVSDVSLVFAENLKEYKIKTRNCDKQIRCQILVKLQCYLP